MGHAGGGGPWFYSRTTAVNGKTTLLIVSLLAAFAGGCGRKIGDQCREALDCNNEDNTRTCDLSQPGGYCTIDGCDEKSCPEESVCIRFFSAGDFLSQECNPADPASCAPQDVCITYSGGNRCAPRSTERRNCMLRCEDDGDCRDDYVCRPSGQSTNMALTVAPNTVVGFCVPR
jgi:hypothetical protein